MIKVNNLNKYYNKGKDNELHVINNVSLELPSTGLVSFLGQSGSGKTTLLNVIGGLDKATGEIIYDDKKIKDYKMKQVDSFRRKEFGYVFQNYNLLLTETVYDNLVLALQMIDIYDKEEQEKRIEYVLKMVGMYKYRKKKAFALSGGQQQRVSIARALVKESKVIIADEPTGNLDSENSIQVMNILKKISKTTLVLMVTHNEDLANFYSDIIYRIKDGEILGKASISSDTTLSKKSSNIIYKKDLNNNTLESNLANINYYSEEEPKKLTLEVIEHNGTFYIESDQNIKLLRDSNLRVLDKHYETLKKEDIDDFEYDTSFFTNKSGKRKLGSEVKNYMKESFHSVSSMKKRTKFLYASFFIIGILFAIAVCSFTNFTVVNKQEFTIDENYHTIYTKDFYSSNEESVEIMKALNNNSINNVNRIITLNACYKDNINYNERIEINQDFPIISTINQEFDLLEGSLPNENEVLISKGIALEMVNKSKGYFKSIDELVGKTVLISKGMDTLEANITISGITKNPYRMTYLPDKIYLEFISDVEVIGFTDSVLARNYEVENHYQTYEIVGGRDLTKDDFNSSNILIPITFDDAMNRINTEITFNDRNYKVCGVYKMKGLTNYYSEYIVHGDEARLYDKPEIPNVLEYSEYKLVDGKIPSSNNEVLVPIYSNVAIGEMINDTYKVVGIYSSNRLGLYSYLMSREMFAASNSIYSKCIFNVTNMEQLNANLKEKYQIKTTYDDIYSHAKKDQNTQLAIFGSFALVLVIILIVFIYFLMRSRMISEIYPIGVYRSLGASKGRIYNKFICDIFVTTSLTSIIGYLGFMILYGTIANTANNLLSGMVLMNSIPMTIIGIVILYLISFIFGLLPIQGLLRKTPSEILSKYDI